MRGSQLVNRDLLNTFTTWELGLIVVGGFVLLAVAGLLVVRRAGLQEAGENDVAGVILGVLAAIYGIVLAFVIVSMYEDFRKTGGDVRTEATALAEVYRDTRGFSPGAAGRIRTAVGDYIYVVQHEEWPAMAHGHESEAAWNALDSLYAAFQGYEPTTESQKVFYAEAVARLNDLASARRERLNDNEESLPMTFEILLVGGAVLLLLFTFFLRMPSARMHAAMVVSVAALLGFNLLLALVLDFPFSGQVVVSNRAFTQGSLASFEHFHPPSR
jgi:amino acid transporter